MTARCCATTGLGLGRDRPRSDEFINAQIPFYSSGRWQVANLSSKIGIGFDRAAVPAPCGPANCTPMTGGAGLASVKHTQHPEAVAKVMEFLEQANVQRESAPLIGHRI